MDISLFSNDYTVRRMEKADVADIYLLCSKNDLYYQYCPPFVTEQSILDDMKALTIYAIIWPASGFRVYGLAGLKAIPRQSIFGIRTILRRRGLLTTRITILWL